VPRRPRSFFEGLYHIAPHASDRRRLFLGDDDRRMFLERLAQVVERFELGLVAYTLMGTHYHAVLSTSGNGIPAALQQLHGSYSRAHNVVRGRKAHLFRAHYMARWISSDGDLLTVCRYLAWNPVVAGLARDPFEWPWSSAAASAGLDKPAIPLDSTPLRAALADSPNWQRRYRDLLLEV
jgi:putative transposase